MSELSNNTIENSGEIVDSRRVLSVQSHVVSGYVGNKAAVFPLQLLGYDVDFINTVEFSNHTGYPKVAGTRMNGEQLEALVNCLGENELIHYDAVLTGYIGSESFIASIVHLIEAARRVHPQLKYTCDPVLGDDGKYYVPESLVPIFIEKIIPMAHMITPNQFEAELLSGIKIVSHSSAMESLLALRAKGPKVVVITSCEFELEDELALETNNEEGKYLNCYVLDGTATDSHTCTVTRFIVSKLPGHFTGTGDATAALMTAWIDRLGPGKAGEAMKRTISSMFGIISNTISIQSHRQRSITGEINAASCARYSELCIVQSKKIIENPPNVEFCAKVVYQF